MKQYIVDAFTQQLFHGNQAAVCVLEDWLSEDLMMDITRENNFSETAFVVQEGSRWHLRWFTPGGEIDLCGHATLACAYVLFRYYDLPGDSLTFTTKSGELTVRKLQGTSGSTACEPQGPEGGTGLEPQGPEGTTGLEPQGLEGTTGLEPQGRDHAEGSEQLLLEMQFPAYTLQPVPVTNAMEEAFGARPTEAYMGRDLLCVFDSSDTIRQLKPDIAKVAQLPGLLQHVTALGSGVTGSTAPQGTTLQSTTQLSTAPSSAEQGAAVLPTAEPSGADTSLTCDCISRSFGPKLQVTEDPVCGSGHCHIIPYWAKKLGKSSLVAYQASARGGTLYCRMDGDKIYMAGHAVLFSVADLYV